MPLGKLFAVVKNISLRLLIVPFFGRYFWLKNKFAKKTSDPKEKIILIFTNRYIIHLIVVIITFGVTTSNILAYENSEDYGRGALIYNIVGVENYDMGDDDTTVASSKPQVFSYLGKNALLQSEQFTEAQNLEEKIYDEQYKSDLATTQGGSTLVKPDLASTESAKITRTSIREYEIQEGDTIGEIAVQFNITVNTILWANNLTTYSYIKPGQKLTIPPTSGVIHEIKNGDTLASIAKKYSADVSQIKNFNNIDNDGLLAVGETIMVPGGRIIYTVKPRTYTTPISDTPAHTTPNVPSGGKLYWPSTCQVITQYYRGWIHTGVDIACDWGTSIRAAEAGTVIQVQYFKTGYGYNIIIDHGGGKHTLYGHLSQIYVVVGQTVQKAEVIALEGSTGRSTGPHLHFEVRINGSKVNPLSYF